MSKENQSFSKTTEENLPSYPNNKIEKISLKYVERFWQRDSFELNGKRVEFLGVVHVPETSYRFRQEIEEAIGGASLVVLEIAPLADGTYSKNSVDWVVREFKKNGIYKTEKQVLEEMESEKGLSFFRTMERIAAAKKKRVATVDPNNLGTSSKLNVTDEKFAYLKAFIATGGTLGYFAVKPNTFLSKFKEILNEDIFRKKNQEVKVVLPKKGNTSPIMSWRKFLGNIIGGIGTLAYGSSVANFIDNEVENRGRKDNPLGPMLYDLLDYRDVSVAEGLDRLTKSNFNTGEGPIVVIYGSAHGTAIRKYADSPKERALKFSSYAPYKKTAPPVLRVYEFEGGKGWRKIEDRAV